MACGQPGVVFRRVAHSTAERAFESQTHMWWLASRPAWVAPGWYDAPLRPAVRHLLSLPPGPELAAALATIPDTVDACPADHSGELGPADPPIGVPGSPCACMVVVAAAWDAQTSWSAERARRALTAAAGSEPIVLPAAGAAPRVVDPAREEIAAALRGSPASTAARIHAARQSARIPLLGSGAEAGAWSRTTAQLIAADLQDCPADTAADIAVELAGKVRQRHITGLRPWTGTETRRAAARITHRLAPGHTAAARRRAKAGRRVEIDHDAHGMSRITAHLPTLDAQRIHRRLTALAAGLDDATRTSDQKRADTLADLLLATPHSRHTPGCQGTCGGDTCAATPLPAGEAAQVNVVVSMETLLGLADDPAEVPGVGPLAPELARTLAAQGAWRAWITDAAGQVTATGTRSYTPGPALARLVRAREPVCRMPGCTRPARQCDLDHAVAYPEGPTTPRNLGPLCRRHHNLKTHRGWRLRITPDHPDDPDTQGSGGYSWTTPAGITIHDRPPPPLDREPRPPRCEPPPDWG